MDEQGQKTNVWARLGALLLHVLLWPLHITAMPYFYVMHLYEIVIFITKVKNTIGQYRQVSALHFN